MQRAGPKVNLIFKRNMVNKVFLVGRVAKDAELKPFEHKSHNAPITGAKLGFYNFSLVTEEFYPDSSPEADPSGWRKKAQWHSIFFKSSDPDKKFLKSTLVAVEGKLEYHLAGNGTFYTSINATSVKFLSRPRPPSAVSDEEAPNTNPGQHIRETKEVPEADR